MKNRTVIIVVGVIVLVLGLAGAAILLTGGDDDSSGVLAPGETPRETFGDDVEQNRPVVVTGDPLPPLDQAVQAGQLDAAIGQTMPVVEGASFDGRPVSIGGPTAGPTMYVFLAHWCPHCNAEIPYLIELKNRDGIPQGMNVVGISTGVRTGEANFPPSDWLMERNWPSQWPVLADSVESTGFNVSGGGGFPYLMIADADGNVLARTSGEKKTEELAIWIAATLDTSGA